MINPAPFVLFVGSLIEPSAEPAPPERAEPVEVEAITAPIVLVQAPAEYPEAAHGSATVTLRVTVTAAGTVGPVEVTISAGEAFDAAALAAVRTWRFSPARRGGTAIDSRITVHIDFTEPEPEPEPGPEPGPEPEPEPEPGPEPVAKPEAIDVTVRGARRLRTTDRGASHYRIDRDVLVAAPRAEPTEMLRTVPGLYIARSEGLAVGHRYMLRGFDADHGQDIEMRVGGLPVNLPSHIHGQGYADLGFLIGEAVQSIEVTEGVSDPRQGDFAVAGTFDIQLGVADRGWRLASSYGRGNQFRQVAMWAPSGQPEETFAAVHYWRADGFGDNRAGQGASGIVQARFGNARARWGHRFLALLHGARGSHAGVVREDDVKDGNVRFLGVYPYPTATAQSAQNGRVLAGYFADYEGQRKDNAELGVWLGFDDFRMLENFTGFLQTSRTLPDVAGRGDLIEQTNRTVSVGLSSRYRTRPYHMAPLAHGTVELGMSGRFDDVAQTQNLVDASVNNQVWDERVRADVRQVDIGMWADLEGRFTQYLKLRAGVRADVLSFHVYDALGNLVPAVRPEDASIPGSRRGAFGVAVGPRTSVQVDPLSWLSLRAAYGEGYRSPQGRQLEDGERAPFTKVRSADVGARWGADERLQVTTTGFFTHLSDDLAFDPQEGRLERVGASRRLGAVVYASSRPVRWMVGAVSVTYVDARLLEGPPATAEEPLPPLSAGDSMPYVPPLIVRADLGFSGVLAPHARPWPLRGRAGAGFSYLSPRPLPYGAHADQVPLLDLTGGLGYGPFDLNASFFNILDRRYAAIAYSFASDWDPTGLRSRTPARHFAAGSPWSFLFTLGVSL